MKSQIAVMKPLNGDYAALTEIVRTFKGRRILLIGDMVADHYIFGQTSRISREAPVLILKYRDEYVVPGQAANTACNLASLGANVLPIGAIGRDRAGSDLKKSMRSCGVRTDLLLQDPQYSTLTKTRILAGGHHTCRQQVIRIDDDERVPITRSVRGKIEKLIKLHIRNCDAIVVSDYGYGLISPEVWEIALAGKKRHDIPLILDSRYQLLKLTGATMVTPNEGEALECFGIETTADYDMEQVGKKLSKRTSAENVLVTRGNEGMALFQRGRTAVHIPIFGTDQVTDVTGAGDTVVSAVSMALASGATPLQSAQIANVAGGLVVMKMGTATVSARELLDAMSK